MNAIPRERAVVLGGGIAGLLAARILSQYFVSVVVVDRDSFDDSVIARRGTPQARHLHGLLARGHEVLETLFPGLTAELVDAGAPIGDMLVNTRLSFGGQRFAAGPSGLTALCVSRPTLETAIRRRVAALPGVRLCGGRDIAGLASSTDRRQVTGVRVVDRQDGTEETWSADLTVVATGRGSRLPAWLSELGYTPPTTERVALDVGYASQRVRLPAESLGDDLVVLSAPTPATPRGGALSLIEGGCCLVTLMGVLGDHPPVDQDGFRRFATDVALPDLANLIDTSEPLDPPVAFRHPVALRHRYDRMPSAPDGLVVLGDAVCSLNPIYGQGMTVAALQALALGRRLDETSFETRRCLRDVGRISGVAWSLALAADLSYPQVEGRRSFSGRLMSRYITRVQVGAARDPGLGRAFLRVTSLVDPPPALLRPSVVRRVVLASAG
ncbi:MAG TPA: FAD-dependent monooxygenase [Lapillicoccus sp.]|nr:FAD-dependent monooxygenase [Lapillicoccus sp.]